MIDGHGGSSSTDSELLGIRSSTTVEAAAFSQAFHEALLAQLEATPHLVLTVARIQALFERQPSFYENLSPEMRQELAGYFIVDPDTATSERHLAQLREALEDHYAAERRTQPTANDIVKRVEVTDRVGLELEAGGITLATSDVLFPLLVGERLAATRETALDWPLIALTPDIGTGDRRYLEIQIGPLRRDQYLRGEVFAALEELKNSLRRVNEGAVGLNDIVADYNNRIGERLGVRSLPYRLELAELEIGPVEASGRFPGRFSPQETILTRYNALGDGAFGAFFLGSGRSTPILRQVYEAAQTSALRLAADIRPTGASSLLQSLLVHMLLENTIVDTSNKQKDVLRIRILASEVIGHLLPPDDFAALQAWVNGATEQNRTIFQDEIAAIRALGPTEMTAPESAVSRYFDGVLRTAVDARESGNLASRISDASEIGIIEKSGEYYVAVENRQLQWLHDLSRG